MGAENIKYKFCFCPKIAKHLHQPVISIGVESCTFSSHLTYCNWGSGGGAPSAWRFFGIYY